MNGIAACVRWDGEPVSSDVLEAANWVVSHLCPDGAWVWTDRHVGLAKAALATLPEDVPGTPVVGRNARIAASCRIDNRDDLIRPLGLGNGSWVQMGISKWDKSN